MPTRKGAALSEFHQSVHQATSAKGFAEKFQKLCQSADRHGAIESLVQLDQVSRLRIDESYHSKDDTEALKIYNKSRAINVEAGERRGIFLKVSFLSRALFAADSRTPLFAHILLERARCWYHVGALSRCIKDCDYLMTLRTGGGGSTRDEASQNNDDRIECAALKAKCAEQMKRLSKNSPKASGKNCTVQTPPRLEGRQNPRLRSCSDAVAMSYDQRRGRHLVATRNIKAGSVLIVDQPFSFSTDGHALRTNCLHCHVSLEREDNVAIPCHNCQTVAYCSNVCRQMSWDRYHKYECTIFDYFYETNVRDIDHARQQRSHLLLAWRTTVAKALDKSTNRLSEEFLCYQELVSNEEKGKREIDATISPYDPLDYRTVFALETHCTDASSVVNLARALKAIFLAKCLSSVLTRLQGSEIPAIEEKELTLVAVGMLRHIQAVDCNAYEIVENWRDEGTKIWEPRNVGGAVYTTVSLVNHGCYPNVVRHSYAEGKVVVRALRFIAKGSEILDCYGPHFVSDSCSSRRRYLMEKYNFSCACEACTNDWQLPDEATYRCPSCGSSATGDVARCPKCGKAIDVKKLESQLAKSVKKRVAAIARMFEGNYADALPNLLEHAAVVDKILAIPSLEAVKTQQSIVQCYNSLASICPSSNIAN